MIKRITPHNVLSRKRNNQVEGNTLRQCTEIFILCYRPVWFTQYSTLRFYLEIVDEEVNGPEQRALDPLSNNWPAFGVLDYQRNRNDLPPTEQSIQFVKFSHAWMTAQHHISSTDSYFCFLFERKGSKRKESNKQEVKTAKFSNHKGKQVPLERVAKIMPQCQSEIKTEK